MTDQQAVEELDRLKGVILSMSKRSERIDGLLQVGCAYSRATQLILQRQERRIADLERRILGGNQCQ